MRILDIHDSITGNDNQYDGDGSSTMDDRSRGGARPHPRAGRVDLDEAGVPQDPREPGDVRPHLAEVPWPSIVHLTSLSLVNVSDDVPE